MAGKSEEPRRSLRSRAREQQSTQSGRSQTVEVRDATFTLNRNTDSKPARLYGMVTKTFPRHTASESEPNGFIPNLQLFHRVPAPDPSDLAIQAQMGNNVEHHVDSVTIAFDAKVPTENNINIPDPNDSARLIPDPSRQKDLDIHLAELIPLLENPDVSAEDLEAALGEDIHVRFTDHPEDPTEYTFSVAWQYINANGRGARKYPVNGYLRSVTGVGREQVVKAADGSKAAGTVEIVERKSFSRNLPPAAQRDNGNATDNEVPWAGDDTQTPPAQA